MIDKIYSRPRIKLKFFKDLSKIKRIKIIFFIVFFLLFVFIVLTIKASYPIFVASCANAASSTATNILNKEVNEVMMVYNYNDLVNLGKDQNRKCILY